MRGVRGGEGRCGIDDISCMTSHGVIGKFPRAVYLRVDRYSISSLPSDKKQVEQVLISTCLLTYLSCLCCVVRACSRAVVGLNRFNNVICTLRVVLRLVVVTGIIWEKRKKSP